MFGRAATPVCNWFARFLMATFTEGNLEEGMLGFFVHTIGLL